MSLRGCEWRALRSIEAELCRSDPWLPAMFAMFARLTPDAPVSGPEVDRGAKAPGYPVWLAWARRFATPAALRLTFFVSVALAAMMCALFLGGGSRAGQCRLVSGPQPASSAAAPLRVPVGHGFAGPPSPARAAAGSARSCPPGSPQPGPPPATQP